jgi:hypothetical protein
VGGEDERGAKERAGGAEHVDGGIAKPPGDRARGRTGDAVGDVEEGDERPIALPRLAGRTRFRASTPSAGKTSAHPRPVTSAPASATISYGANQSMTWPIASTTSDQSATR